MRTRIVLTTALVALLPLAATAQNPNPAASPAPTAGAATPSIPPVPPPAPPHPPRMPNNEPRGPFTFLGVETSRVPRVVSEQMGLPRGFGLVVDYVVPKSSAALAGLQQNDIIRMLNDQIIVDSDQLGVLVRSFADGTSVSLTVLRKGQEVKLTAKLQQKQTNPDHGAVGYNWNFDGMENMEDFHMPDMSSVREAVSRAKAEALRAGDEAAREVAKNLRIVTASGGTVKASHIDLGKAQIVFTDEKGELRIETVNGKKMLTAKDASGKVLFNGPIDTDQERAKIPPDVRKRYDNLEHQELPPVPPNEQLAPHAPNLQESAQLQNKNLEQAVLAPNAGSGWRRDTVVL
ncbi:MAG: PDZ domain-containing protein [Chthoniobacterales bacterium]